MVCPGGVEMGVAQTALVKQVEHLRLSRGGEGRWSWVGLMSAAARAERGCVLSSSQLLSMGGRAGATCSI